MLKNTIKLCYAIPELHSYSTGSTQANSCEGDVLQVALS